MTLEPDLVISGSVTDAVDRQAVPRFHVIQGFDQPQGRQWWFRKKGITWCAWPQWNTPAVVTR